MKKYLYILLLLVIASSCNDFLSKNPDNRTFLDEPEKIKEFLVSAYPYIGHQFTDILTENVTDVGLGYMMDDADLTLMLKQLYSWQTPDVIHSLDNPNDYWYACYEAIAYANYALEALDDLVKGGEYSESEIAPIRAEALMCRAYTHFMLVNLYGEHYNPATASTTLGIPIVDKAERTADVKYTRNTVKEVYDFIEKDIEHAFPYINNGIYSKPKWHFNREAAATFASRFYLYRGLDTDWNKVIYYANQVLGSDPAASLRNLASLQSIPDYEQRMINYSRSEHPCNLLLISTLSYNWAYGTSRYAQDENLLKDKVRNMAHPTENTVTGTRYLPGKVMLSWGLSHPNQFFPKYNQYFRYSDINSSEGWPYMMYAVLETEEALFNMMEAYVMVQNYDGAVQALNNYYSKRLESYDETKDIITKASVLRRYQYNTLELAPYYTLTNDQNIFLKCILTIRNAEFQYEGLRWFDVKRMHLQVEHRVVGGEKLVLGPNDPRRVFQLPSAALSEGITGNFVPENGTGARQIPPMPPIAVPQTYEDVK